MATQRENSITANGWEWRRGGEEIRGGGEMEGGSGAHGAGRRGDSRHTQGWEMESEEGIMIEIEHWRVADR